MLTPVAPCNTPQNSGVAPAVDINDIAPGLYTGAAADRGGRETW